jgi:hypothetical protein
MVMDWTREQLWNRMDALDAFDWCEPQQYAALRALFFDGVLWQGDEYPPTWMTCRELFFHLVQTPEQWARMVKLRSTYTDEDGATHTSESMAASYRAEALSHLLGRDHQYCGMGVAQQLEMLEWLGWMQASPSCAALDAWVGDIHFWLNPQPRNSWVLDECDDSRHAHALPWLYHMLEKAPLVMQGRWLAATETGWCYEIFPRTFLQSLQSLMRRADKGKVPHRPGLNPKHRQDFLRQLRDDLVAGKGGAVLQQVWAMTRQP